MARKLESWEREPLWMRALTPFLEARRFPVMPENPEHGRWYRFYPDGAVSGNGEPMFTDVRLGTENKLLVFFSGGGVSIDEYTAARPASLYMRDKTDMFYTTRLDLFADFVTRAGVLDDHPDNPFRDWTKVVLTYGTGDFHVGTKDFPYTALDGSARVLRHHGYTNYRAVLEAVTRWVPEPDDLLVAGCSAGAWGAALLADDVIGLFPECSRITCCVDSGLGVKADWGRIAEDVWGAPEEIRARLRGSDMVSDSLAALHRDHGDRVEILYASSTRDAELSRMQGYLDGDGFEHTRRAGERFEGDLRRVSAELVERIPRIGLYFFDTPDRAHKRLGLTKHCMIADAGFHRTSSDGIAPREWLKRTVFGRDPQRVGLDLLATSSA
ncbi:hypothetical protein M2317_002812 [Microbacterium sp. ZKA21]